jgi:hypothetical protein
MARYHLNLHECGTVYLDEEGMEFPNVEAVRAQAIKEARSIMAAEVREGQLCLSCHIEVEDDCGQVIFKLAFKDALAVTGL